MTPEEAAKVQAFEKQFVESSTPMVVTATLPAAPPYVPAMVWARDRSHHITAMYCGCADVQVVRNSREVFTVCPKHRIQPVGTASRIRTNKMYAGMVQS